MKKKIELGLVVFREDEADPPFLKAHLKPRFEELDDDEMEEEGDSDEQSEDETVGEDDEEVGLQVIGSYFYKQSQVAVRYLKALMGAKVFDNPKDHEVLTRIIHYCTSDNDLIVDFFAGSASTAEAVLSLNHTNTNSRRRFILVQLPEPTRRKRANGTYVEKLAYKLGFKTIADLAKERIRRVIANLREKKAESFDFGSATAAEDLGFKVFKLASPNIRQWTQDEERDPEIYGQKLAFFNDPLVANWKPDNVIWEVALREGFGLNTRFAPRDLANGNKVYDVTDPDSGQKFTICLDDKILIDLLKHCELKPGDQFVCRDVALDDSAAANLALQCRLKTI